jgi:hypothetical protein
MRRIASILLAGALALGAFACKKKEEAPPPPPPPPVEIPEPAPPAPLPFRVTAVTLGSGISEDNRPMPVTEVFAAADTIYASIESEGEAASVTLTARWTYEDGQVVHEESQTIVPSGPAVSEFHISKPDGWPTGKYRVEISADGALAGSREFTVQ